MGNFSPEIWKQRSSSKGQTAAFAPPCFSSSTRSRTELNTSAAVVWLIPKPVELTTDKIEEVENLCKSHQCKPNLPTLSKRRCLIFKLALAPWLQRGLGVQRCPSASLFMSPPPSVQGDLPPSLPGYGHVLEMRPWTLGTEMLVFWDSIVED